MFNFIHQFAFYFHVTVGSLALVIFWLPLMVKKGSKNHLRFGKLFVLGMYVVSISGFIMSMLVLIDPVAVRLPNEMTNDESLQRFINNNRVSAGFLLMLSVLVFSNVRQSILVLKVKANREMLKKPLHLSIISILGLLGLFMAWVGINNNIILFIIFAAVSVLNSIGMLHYIFKPEIKPREWIIAHLGNIVGAGIGAYTAFFAFGGRRLFAGLLTGDLQIIPWILPTIVGIFVTSYFTRKYRQQYRVAG